jgi:hypothetical protein
LAVARHADLDHVDLSRDPDRVVCVQNIEGKLDLVQD